MTKTTRGRRILSLLQGKRSGPSDIVKAVASLSEAKGAAVDLPNWPLQKQLEMAKRNVSVSSEAWHLLKMAEECNELADAIMKFFTKDGPKGEIEAEIGDVKIAIQNCEVFLSIPTICNAMVLKYDRIADKLNELEGN